MSKLQGNKSESPPPAGLAASASGALLVAISASFCACQTPQSVMPPFDLSQPGWSIHQGQAIWRPNTRTTEIAGELVVATHRDGRAFVQFTKTPLPFVVARTSTNGWQIQFVPENRLVAGRGEPPARLVWLHLARCLADVKPPPPVVCQLRESGDWRLENRSTGETIEGYLAP